MAIGICLSEMQRYGIHHVSQGRQHSARSLLQTPYAHRFDAPVQVGLGYVESQCVVYLRGART